MLRGALESIAAALANARWGAEVVVVNNACTDETASVLEEFAERMPLRPVFEPRPGLSNARNAAVRAASGTYLVWTDDDVLVDPGWLQAYETAFLEHPAACFFGGPIRPRFEGLPPAWLLAALPSVASTFAARDFGPDAFRIEQRRHLPFGANFAIRGEEQRALRYDPRFGRQPANYWLAGDEMDLLLRLLDEGGEGRWVPAAGVCHRIPAERQTLRHLLRYGFGLGQTLAIKEPAGGGRRLLSRPAFLWRACVSEIAEATRLRITRGPEEWVPALRNASIGAGRLYGSAPRVLRRANERVS
jgi:glycosyltransferase involved in cell wall biosynthesis